jgi:hypothetical protein
MLMLPTATGRDDISKVLSAASSISVVDRPSVVIEPTEPDWVSPATNTEVPRSPSS